MPLILEEKLIKKMFLYVKISIKFDAINFGGMVNNKDVPKCQYIIIDFILLNISVFTLHI